MNGNNKIFEIIATLCNNNQSEFARRLSTKQPTKNTYKIYKIRLFVFFV